MSVIPVLIHEVPSGALRLHKLLWEWRLRLALVRLARFEPRDPLTQRQRITATSDHRKALDAARMYLLVRETKARHETLASLRAQRHGRLHVVSGGRS